VLATSDTVTATSRPVQRTLAIPLEWDPDAFGGSRSNPIVHREFQLGKEVTLNYAGMGPVAEYRTVVVSQGRIEKAAVEMPAIYLRGDLSAIELYDAQSRTAQALSVPINSMSGTAPTSGWGGLIASNTGGTLAFGVYGVRGAQGGSVAGAGSGFQFGRFVDPSERAPSLPDAHTTTKINALRVGPLEAGRNVFRAFLISGTRAEVERQMAALASAGYR
jgi:hypothetical protein